MENLLITTICRHTHSVFLELSKIASKYECYINYGQLFTLGLDHSLLMQISGNWNHIAKIEATLPALAKKLEVELLFKRTPQEKADQPFLPYQIELMAINQPGIVFEVADFLNTIELPIQKLEITSRSYRQTLILKMNLDVDLSADNNIADIREQFLLFCDELNLDGTLEPKK